MRLNPRIRMLLIMMGLATTMLIVACVTQQGLTISDDQFVYHLGSNEDLVITFESDINEALELTGLMLTASDYQIDGDVITIDASYLESLALAEHTLTLSAGEVSVSFVVIINDRPVATHLVIDRYVGEMIDAYDLFQGVTNEFGDLVLSLTTTPLDHLGTIDVNADEGEFSFDPDVMFAGTYDLSYFVTDTYGATSDQKTLSVRYHAVEPVIADEVPYDMASDEDLTIPFNPNGTEESLVDYVFMTLGINDQPLDEEDVIVLDDAIKINKDVLKTIGYGTHAAQIQTTGGSTLFTVLIHDSRDITSSEPLGTYARGSLSDVVFPMDFFDKTISSVSIGEIMLEIGLDVIIGEETLLISHLFLETLTTGTHVIVINDTLELTLNVVEHVIEGVLFDDVSVTYDGTAQMILPANLPDGAEVSYDPEGPFIDAGIYLITLHVTKEGFMPLELEATLTILKATYDLSLVTFEDQTHLYDGTPQSILISGDLPLGVSVSYQGNGVTEPGIYLITASFSGDDNHHGIEPLTATLTILSDSETDVVINPDDQIITLDHTLLPVPDRYVRVQSYGSDITSVLIVDLDHEHYVLDETGITLKASYLETLGIGLYEYVLQNGHGKEDTFQLVVSGSVVETDHPDGQVITKFTNETIINEPFRVAALVGSVIEVIIESDVDPLSGTLSYDIQTMTFSFERSPGFWGTTSFSFIAVDLYGFQSDVITMEIIYKALNPTILDKDDKTYDKAVGDDPAADIIYTISEMHGLPFDVVSGHGITTEDYVYDNGFLTIFASYLDTLEFGVHDFLVKTDGGSETITITVMDDLPPSTPNPLITWTKPEITSVKFAIETYANPLGSVSIGETILVSGVDYTYEDGLLTIFDAVLQGLPYGETTLTVTNTRGTLDLYVWVRSDLPPTIDPDEDTYIKGTLLDLEIAIETYGNTFEGITGAGITESDVAITDTMVTIDHLFLETLEDGTYDLVFRTVWGDFVGETTFALDISTIILDPVIEGVIDTYDADQRNHLTYDVTLHGHTLEAIYQEGEEVFDWSYEAGILTLDKHFFNDQFTTSTITFEALFSHQNGDVSVAFEANTIYLNALNRLINPGFETGDLFGWTAYGIWKDEVGMQAFEDARITDGTYFDQGQGYPYNRDGEFNLGVVWEAENGFGTWDASSERMGYLKSSEFVLGGSGFISFKLGGGRNPSFAYVSIRRSDTDEEVARYANHQFNQTGIATSQMGVTIDNAEAFMFQYYADLLAIDGVEQGDAFYVILTDAAGFDWSILSADTFETYYAIAPSIDPDMVAINIAPAIQGIQTATNQLIGGHPFDAGLSGWTNVNDAFRFDGDGARSDVDGNTSTGVLRSSAFHVNGDLQYLRFDWAGGLTYDKQIFISIKEVHTNIEVIRIVRRENLGSKQSNGFDNHMADLSTLDPQKTYYVEIADNRTGGWGVTHIKSIRLVDINEWESVVNPHPGDQAVLVEGLTTDFGSS